MSKNNHSGRGVYGKSYYIVIALCAAAIGIAGYRYYRNAEQAQQVSQQPQTQETVSVDAVQEDVPVIATEPRQSAQEAATQPSTAAKKAMKTAAPVAGETVVGYAMECLSYNQTTRDWRVHNGVDIAAEAGAQVLAAADGVVYTTYTDDLMGTTVVIRHDDGYVTQYASLSEELAVSAGDEVTLGQVIGCVGETALVETAIGPHVHFSVLHNDESIDPAEFLALNAE